MKWRNQRQSTNVEDRRGVGGAVIGGGGIGTLLIGLAIYFLTGNTGGLVNQPQVAPPSQSQPAQGARAGSDDETKRFVSSVLASTEDVWGQIFRQRGQTYRQPKLVLFSGQVRSACGIAGSATGPFYCPLDQKLYLDTSFFQQMQTQLGASGDFAQAYVIAHEVGHHVQNQLGTMRKVQSLQQRASEKQANKLSVNLELQADFYAGVWAHHAARQGLLEPGDVEEAIGAASAVGDDRLQQRAQGHVVPDSFTHGSSRQRAYWFARGLKTGDITQGDTSRGP